MPNQAGEFKPDTMPDDMHIGILAYENEIPIGFCIAKVESEVHAIAEFYIIPVLRSEGLGSEFAIEIFNRYPGKWQVRQIEGADKARDFWRKAINSSTNNNFEEDPAQRS